MSQYNLPAREKPRRKAEGPQVASVVSEAAENAPKLLLHLAKQMFGGGTDPRTIYKKTGWYQDLDGQWLYSIGDQNMKVRDDNPLLSKPDYSMGPTGTEPGYEIRQYEKPGIPMKHEEGVDPVGPQDQKGVYKTRGGELGAREPNKMWDKQLPPAPSPMLGVRQRMYPDFYDNPDQMDFSEAIMNDKSQGYQGYEDWESWRPAPFDPAKQRSNEPSAPRFDELFSHQNLFDLSPEAGDPKVGSRYTFGGPQDYKGAFLDIGKGGLIDAQGSLGGVRVPNSMESVALHESGHKNQRTYNMPRGGNDAETGMDDRGIDMMLDAQQRSDELDKLKPEQVATLMKLGMSEDDAWDKVDSYYPNMYEWHRKYEGVAQGQANDKHLARPGDMLASNYLGYRGEAGEVQSKNLQERAATLTNRIPMTGEKPWNQFPNGPGSSNEAHFALGDMDDELRKRHEGDVHPLDTYNIPPDLTRLRYGSGKPERTPRLGEYDWLFKGPAASVAGAGTLATLGLGAGQAEASPKGDRVGAETRDEVQQRRLGLAKATAADADLRATGGTSPEMPDTLSKLGLTRSAATGARNAAEEYPSSLLSATPVGAAMAVTKWLTGGGPDARDMVSGESIGKQTDKVSPDWLQWLTRYKPQGPVEEGTAQVPQWWLF